MGLVPRPQGRIASGRILLDGTDLDEAARAGVGKTARPQAWR